MGWMLQQSNREYPLDGMGGYHELVAGIRRPYEFPYICIAFWNLSESHERSNGVSHILCKYLGVHALENLDRSSHVECNLCCSETAFQMTVETGLRVCIVSNS